ncbi:MAG: hypothetical protein NVS3B1_12560 [Marmoricola sp.]
MTVAGSGGVPTLPNRVSLTFNGATVTDPGGGSATISESGAVGPQGPSGASGAPGPAGASGAPGPQGPAGASGAPGPAGPAGAGGGGALTVSGSGGVPTLAGRVALSFAGSGGTNVVVQDQGGGSAQVLISGGGGGGAVAVASAASGVGAPQGVVVSAVQDLVFTAGSLVTASGGSAIVKGYNVRGTWASAQTYGQLDIVQLNGSAAVATAPIASGGPSPGPLSAVFMDDSFATNTLADTHWSYYRNPTGDNLLEGQLVAGTSALLVYAAGSVHAVIGSNQSVYSVRSDRDFNASDGDVLAKFTNQSTTEGKAGVGFFKDIDNYLWIGTAAALGANAYTISYDGRVGGVAIGATQLIANQQLPAGSWWIRASKTGTTITVTIYSTDPAGAAIGSASFTLPAGLQSGVLRGFNLLDGFNNPPQNLNEMRITGPSPWQTIVAPPALTPIPGVTACTVTGTLPLPGEASPGVLAKIACNTVVTDTDGYWDSTNARFTPQRAGRYLVTAYFNGSAVGAAGTFWDLAVRKNGASAPTWLNRLPSSNAYGPNIVTTAQIAMNGSTDFIELWGGQGAGGSVAGDERLEIVYLGPN